MKIFTNKKINEGLYKPEKLNFAVVLKNGELYIHEHGQSMLECVYNHEYDMCDVTDCVRDYVLRIEDRKGTVRLIRETAEDFYN